MVVTAASLALASSKSINTSGVCPASCLIWKNWSRRLNRGPHEIDVVQEVEKGVTSAGRQNITPLCVERVADEAADDARGETVKQNVLLIQCHGPSWATRAAKVSAELLLEYLQLHR